MLLLILGEKSKYNPALSFNINYILHMLTMAIVFHHFLQNFIYKWDRSHSCSITDVERIKYETSVQLIFKYVDMLSHITRVTRFLIHHYVHVLCADHKSRSQQKRNYSVNYANTLTYSYRRSTL